jgi:DNA-binding FadR family transcriptional regulator
MFFERAAAISSHSLIELLEIRRGLEIQSVTLAAGKRTDDKIEEMRRLIADMRAHLHESEVYTDLDLRLHFLIASASRNTLMLYLIQSIRDVLRSTIQEGLRSRFTLAQTLRVQELHEAIVEAIARQDVEVAAAAAMSAHFDDAINAIYRSMIHPDGEKQTETGE